jgi:hypothetical protein
VDLAQKLDFSATPAAMAETCVATQTEGKLKGIERVGITNMCVQFIAAKSAVGVSRRATRRGSTSEACSGSRSRCTPIGCCRRHPRRRPLPAPDGPEKTGE